MVIFVFAGAVGRGRPGAVPCEPGGRHGGQERRQNVLSGGVDVGVAVEDVGGVVGGLDLGEPVVFGGTVATP